RGQEVAVCRLVRIMAGEAGDSLVRLVARLRKEPQREIVRQPAAGRVNGMADRRAGPVLGALARLMAGQALPARIGGRRRGLTDNVMDAMARSAQTAGLRRESQQIHRLGRTAAQV